MTFEEMLAAARNRATAPAAPATPDDVTFRPSDLAALQQAPAPTVLHSVASAQTAQAPARTNHKARTVNVETEKAPAPAAPANPFDLSKTAVLADVSVKMWSGQVHDKAVTREVARQHGASVDMGRFTKKLVASERLKAIKQAAQDLGDFHRSHTLPWGEGNQRALAAGGVLEYETGCRERIENIDRLADAFCDEWDAIREQARTLLGSMFNPDEYPSRSALRGKFKAKVTIARIPTTDTSDFRTTFGKDEAARLQRQIEADAREAVRMAQGELVDRVRETVGHMADRLKAERVTKKGEPAPAIFRDSLTQNVRDLADLIGSLNITADPRLKDLAAEMRLLGSYHPDALRDMAAPARKEIAAQAEDLVAKAEEFFA